MSVAAAALVAVPGASVGADDEREPGVVRAVGGPDMRPNKFFVNTFRFQPGRVKVRTGDTLTWRDESVPPHPHTVTIVEAIQLPVTFAEMGACNAPTGACTRGRNAHDLGPGGTPVAVVNVGAPGLDAPGDSLFFPPSGDISAAVSAPPGRTLFYLCVLHPWMQGEIRVKR